MTSEADKQPEPNPAHPAKPAKVSGAAKVPDARGAAGPAGKPDARAARGPAGPADKADARGPAGKPDAAPVNPVVGRAKVSSWVPDWREISDRLRIPRAKTPVSPQARGVASVPRPAAPPVKGGPPKEAQRKARRRRRWLGVVLAVCTLLLGLGFIGGSYFYDTVPRPSELTLINNTEVFARDGQSQLAKLGTQNRTEIAITRLPKQVRDAVIAGEDKHFYEHHGIDMLGIARAAWNNLTGGSLQGASTITQQYARQAANDMEISYARKVREAVMARKIEDSYTKDEILGFYLNTVYFGRGAYGIAAAARAYFDIPHEKIETLTVAQAAVLGAVLKQPEPESGSAKGYDPQNDPDAAKGRWHYVLGNMIENGWLSTSERAGMSYPEVRPYDPAKTPGSFGYTDSGTGYVINYVARELAERGVVAYLNENKLGNWKNAGLRITTTIDPRVQKALEGELNRAVPDSTMSKQRENIIGAGVVIDPTNGRVLAYYGGTNNGTDTDWAGTDHPHPPASTFKMYTLAAAVSEGYKVKSYWNSRELKKATDGFDLTNASRESDPTCDEYCTLEEMTIRSFNVPFFEVARKITPKKVIEVAHKAGVKSLYTTDLKRYELSQGIPGREVFDYYAGIGQYPITVLDHASGTATFANHGIHHAPHFVVKVERKNRKTGRWEHLSIGDERIAGTKALDSVVVDEVVSVLKQIPGDAAVVGEGRESAGKTGTWENPNRKGTTAHTWFTGFTEQLATTIWIGSNDVNATPLTTVQGGVMGSLFPRAMWKRVMDRAHQELNLPATKLSTSRDYGRIDIGTGKSPSPSPSPTPPPASPSPTPTVSPTGRP